MPETSERIEESENAASPEELVSYFMNPEVTTNYEINTRSADRDKVMEILCEEHGFTRERVDAGLERLGSKKGQSTLDAWF